MLTIVVNKHPIPEQLKKRQWGAEDWLGGGLHYVNWLVEEKEKVEEKNLKSMEKKEGKESWRSGAAPGVAQL